MASVKNLKKDINSTFGDVIENVYAWELENPKGDTEKSSEIIDEALLAFDELIEKVNDKKARSKTNFTAIKKEFQEKSSDLYAKIGAL